MTLRDLRHLQVTDIVNHPVTPLVSVRLLSLPANLLALGLLSRVLPAEEFGLFILFLSVMGIGVVGFGLGISRNFLRILGDHRQRADRPHGSPSADGDLRVKELVAALFVTYFAMLVITILTAGVISLVGNHSITPSLAISFALAGLLMAFIQVCSEGLRAHFRLWLGAYFSTIGLTLLLSLIIVGCVVAGVDSVATMILCIVVGFVLSAVVAGFLLVRETGIAWPKHLKFSDFSIVTVSIPVFGMDLLILITNQLDSVIVSMGFDLAALAEYGKAYRLTAIVGLLMTVQASLITPFIPQYRAQGDIDGAQKFIRKWATIMATLAIFILGLLVVFGSSIGSLVFGNYSPMAQSVLYAMAAYQLVNICVGPASEILIMFGERWPVFWITATGSLVALSGMVLTGIILKTELAIFAWTVAAGVIVTQVGFLLYCRKATGIWSATRWPFALYRQLRFH